MDNSPDHGKTNAAVTIAPVTIESPAPDDRPVLEYSVHSFHAGDIAIHSYFSPTLNFHGRELRYAISVDDEEPQIISLHENFNLRAWEQAVANSIIIKSSKHKFLKPGSTQHKILRGRRGSCSSENCGRDHGHERIVSRATRELLKK